MQNCESRKTEKGNFGGIYEKEGDEDHRENVCEDDFKKQLP